MDFSSSPATPNTNISTLSRKASDPRLSSAREAKQLEDYLMSSLGVSRATAQNLIRRNPEATMKGLREMTNIYRQNLQGGGPRAARRNNAQPAPQRSIFSNPQAQKQETIVQQQLQGVYQARTNIAEQKKVPTEQVTTQNKVSDEGIVKLFAKLSPLISDQVNSPKQFASLLVNNQGLFVLLKSNPNVFNFLLGATNQNMQMSPVMLSEMAKFLGMLLKLKQGGSTYGVDEDEQVKFDRAQEDMLDASEHENEMVKNIKETINKMPTSPLRDFLLEAERFAEEEIANMWSITLKKEKELEKSIGAVPEELRHLMEKFPHLEPAHLLEKYRKMQREQNKRGKKPLQKVAKR